MPGYNENDIVHREKKNSHVCFSLLQHTKGHVLQQQNSKVVEKEEEEFDTTGIL